MSFLGYCFGPQSALLACLSDFVITVKGDYFALLADILGEDYARLTTSDACATC